MLTMVQKGFYFSHSLPYFAIGLALLIAPGLLNLIDRINTEKTGFKIFRVFSLALFTVAIIVSIMQIGKTRRQKDLLNDVYIVGELVPNNSSIAIEHSMFNDHWDLQCYLIRHFNISVDPDHLHEYYLVTKNIEKPIPNNYEKVPIKTMKFDLYKVKN